MASSRQYSIGSLFTMQSRLLTTPREKTFENIVGKGENAGNQHFLLFPQCFLSFPNQISIFDLHLICSLQMLSIWTSLKNLLFGKELNDQQLYIIVVIVLTCCLLNI